MLSETPARGRYPGRGLHGAVVERLGRRIVEGCPAPGEALPREPLLAQEYDVSRTVIREALRVLAAKGLVDARPMRGTRVRPRGEWRLLDPDLLRWTLESEPGGTLLGQLLEIRLMVEPTAARLAAQRSSDLERAHLEVALSTMIDASTDAGAYVEADLLLHAAIFEMTANPLLAELITPIEAALRLGRRVQARGADVGSRPPARSIEAHRLVIDAIVAGDGPRAEADMRAVVEAAAADAEQAIGRSLYPGALR